MQVHPDNSVERKFKKAVMDRLARMESRLVEGFSQLGANVKDRPDERIKVDEVNGVVYLPHSGVSIMEVMRHLAAGQLEEYEIECNGVVLGVLYKE
jgi:hypothetical protein